MLPPLQSLADLDDALSTPTPAVISALAQSPGDILILGVAGKMGPSLARMAKRASESKTGTQLFSAPHTPRKIIGVARFSNPAVQSDLESHGIQTIQADLLNPTHLANLPDAPNIIFMAGMKFGSTNQEPLTWAMNTYLPGRVAERFPHSRIVAFSTGNIYGLSPISAGGSLESDPPNPLGDYAQSCLGRERIFSHFSQTLGIPLSIIRLNYACELRYGVLVDLAQQILHNHPIDLAMPAFNTIWQADANAHALASLPLASSPPLILNVTGPETLHTRSVAQQFAQLMNTTPNFINTEPPDALLSNAALSQRLFGPPRISPDQLIHWITHWLTHNGPTLNKPTHFQTRDGKF